VPCHENIGGSGDTEVSGQLYILAALPLGKWALVPIGFRVGGLQSKSGCDEVENPSPSLYPVLVLIELFVISFGVRQLHFNFILYSRLHAFSSVEAVQSSFLFFHLHCLFLFVYQI